jgi:putative ABC transport system permease protein
MGRPPRSSADLEPRSNHRADPPGQGFGRGGGGPQPPDFKIEDLDAIRTQIVGVTAVAPLVQSTGTAVYNAANWSTTVNGTSREYFIAQPWTFTGRIFSAPRNRPARRSASSATPSATGCSQ